MKPEKPASIPKAWAEAVSMTCNMLYDESYKDLMNKTEDYDDFYKWFEFMYGEISRQLAGTHSEVALLVTGMLVKAYVAARREVSDGCPYYSFRPKFIEALGIVTSGVRDMTNSIPVKE